MYNNRKVIAEFLNNPTSVGEIAPFSETTIKELLIPINERLKNDKHTDIIRILEVGAGEGGVTRSLMKLKSNNPRLSINVVELENGFCVGLKDIVTDQAALNCPRDILSYENGKFDFIISTIPEQNLSADVLKQIFEKFKSSLKNSGVISRVRYKVSYTYVWPLLSKKTKNRVKSTMKVIRKFEDKETTTTKTTVWKNIPPTGVYASKFMQTRYF